MTDAIIPDDKDWTWVLERECPECGLDSSAIGAVSVAGMIRSNVEEWAALLLAPADDLRLRPLPERWSTLEYAAHVRDVFVLYRHRLGLMIDHDDPLFPNWDQDETAVQDRYGEQDPAVVAGELSEAAELLAARFDALPEDPQLWRRPGRRSDGAAFTLTTFSQYLVHDPVHHVWDIQHAQR